MHIDHFHSAELDSETLQSIKRLEQKLGVIVVAMESDPEPALLKDEELALIKELEQKTGKILVAYKHSVSH